MLILCMETFIIFPLIIPHFPFILACHLSYMSVLQCFFIHKTLMKEIMLHK